MPMKNTSVNEPKANGASFKVGEVVELKGLFFKVTIADAFTGSLGLKQISENEAAEIQNQTDK